MDKTRKPTERLKMTFDEEFPGLVDKYFSINCPMCSRPSFHAVNIQEFCLDKQRVEKAIVNVLSVGYGDKAIKLLKELGLGK